MTIAKAGERVTCENGHHICTVGRDIEAGGVQKPEDFMDWKQPEPELGTLMPMTCDVCGGRWMRLDDICIEGEWREFAAFKDVKREEIAPGSYRIQGTKIIWRKR